MSSTLTQLREVHNANKTELYKQFSIISAAGMGFNLLETLPKGIGVCGFPFFAWWASTILFLVTILAVMGLFYLTASKAAIETYLEDSDENLILIRLIESRRRRIIIWIGLAMACVLFAFTTAIASAIYVVVMLYF